MIPWWSEAAHLKTWFPHQVRDDRLGVRDTPLDVIPAKAGIQFPAMRRMRMG
jgi:hypothetical protein